MCMPYVALGKCAAIWRLAQKLYWVPHGFIEALLEDTTTSHGARPLIEMSSSEVAAKVWEIVVRFRAAKKIERAGFLHRKRSCPSSDDSSYKKPPRLPRILRDQLIKEQGLWPAGKGVH